MQESYQTLPQYDAKSVITIDKEGNANKSPLKELTNNIVYQGSENVLILSRVYTTTWVCEFDLAMYPFDEQKCDMIFAEQVFKSVCM